VLAFDSGSRLPEPARGLPRQGFLDNAKPSSCRLQTVATGEIRMLQEYKRKRDFKITPEPSGAVTTGKGKAKTKKIESLSFVIQMHAARRLHYDFRLEVDGVMVSWAVPKGPSLSPKDKRLAVMTEDHPMEYSDFEGIIPDKQYGAGEVIIWDQGVYSPDDAQVYSWDDKEDANKRMREGLKRGKLSFYLKGDKLEGSWTLVKLRNKDKDWLLIKHHDKFEDAERDVTEEDASVVSGRTLADLQENGADRIWTAKGSQAADRDTTGKSAKKKSAAESSKNPQAVGSATLAKGSQSQPAKMKVKKLDQAQLKELLRGGKRAAFPKEVSPMLATLADAPFTLDGWFFEPKLDGVRAIAYIKDGECRLSSRRGNNLTANYPAVCKGLSGYDENFVFDGEVVALDENGRPSFQYLQQSTGGLRSFGGNKDNVSEAILVYYVFDILYAAGKDLTDLPVVERKKILDAVLKTNETVRPVHSLGSDGLAVFQACTENGLEGIVGKREDSTYELGRRTRSWLKVKTSLSGEFLICGFTEGTGSRQRTFGSLLLGEHDSHGNLHFVGGVGTGFDAKKLGSLMKTMKPLITKQCPFKKKPPGKLNPTWVDPKLVVEVKFLERTQDNILRAPVYLHLREDIEPGNVKEAAVVHIDENRSSSSISAAASEKPATEKLRHDESSKHRADQSDSISVLEQLDNEKEKVSLEVDGHLLPLTSLNKVYWPAHGNEPAITKRDYLRYLAKVSQFVIPHLTDRLLTLVRFPNGINEGRFYQKHWEQNLPKFVKTARVYTEHEKKDQDFLVCNNLPTLLWLGQIADLEFHTSHTRLDPRPDAINLPTKMTGSVEELEASIANYPDYVVLDLDPYLYSGREKKGDEPALHRQGFENCCDVAFYLKKHLDDLKLESFIKTSGKTGLHIYIPIERNIDYDTVRSLSEIICRQVLTEHPDEVTMDWAVVKRTGKVFMDHNMNARSKSLASIYSPRVAPEGCVSTPLDWNELRKVYPTDFIMRSLPDRLAQKGDLWSDILDHKHDLRVILSRESGSSGTENLAALREKKGAAKTPRNRRRGT
jgi:bifunctional non-homologous end joining protein LigD